MGNSAPSLKNCGITIKLPAQEVEMFEHLFQPINIGKVQVKNRLWVAPTQTFSGAGDGLPSEMTYEFYEERAKGGWGVVAVEAAFIRKDGNCYPLFLGVARDDQAEAAGKIADIMHKHGLPASIQLVHGGRGAVQRVTGLQTVTPSDTFPEGGVIEWPPAGDNKPHAMTTAEVDELIDDFVAAVLRVKKFGFEMAFFHGAHGFIFNNFQAHYTNHRTDKYAGPTAFTVEVIKRARQAVGPDFSLGLRMNGDDFFPGGITLEQAVRMAPEFVAAGLDWLDVSAGTRERQPWSIQPLYFPRGCMVHLAEAIKKVVNVPVICVARINDPRLADDIVAKGRADIVAMCRGALADPELPIKAQEGRLEDIRRCMGCDLCMEGVGTKRENEMGKYQAVTAMCAENYAIGRFKWEWELKPTDTPKKIMVVGGGVAGMEFARVASLRGHEVTLYDGEEKLGGAIRYLASRIPNLNTRDLMNSVIFLSTALQKQGVKVVLGKEITPEFVEEQNPDFVVLATGAKPEIPDVPGVNNSNVIILDDYLRNRPPVGKRVVVIGGQHGFETSMSLVKEGKDVTVVEETEQPGVWVSYLTRRRKMTIYDYYFGPKPIMLVNSKAKKINDSGVVIVDSEGKESLVEADTVIIALNRLPYNPLKDALEGKLKEVYSIGDCVEPKNTMNAIHSAYELARKI